MGVQGTRSCVPWGVERGCSSLEHPPESANTARSATPIISPEGICATGASQRSQLNSLF
jgi:hypothetical protein